MWNDPIVQEVRLIREQLAAKFDFDVQAIFADLRSRECKLGRRLAHGTENLRSKQATVSDVGCAAMESGR